MSIVTLGTNLTTSLSALLSSGAEVPADIATIANGIKNDQVNGLPIFPGAYSNTNLLFIPNRGVLKVLPGDYVAIDSTGWPILVSSYAIANGPWTHS